eukprot:TRINITY_DN25452_c0_g1_i1.p2 TRINITY_DN25452_c0_g1~~TRINITY_DN25452_c0_g1_i1.p2  ORF type:complete len:530 (+),score=245.60 TRINITY_DN25452_c0_g1_i1:125-1714(+)
MVKVAKKKSKRLTTRHKAKVVKKVSQFKKASRRTVKKLRKAGLITKRKEKDPALQIPNSWPNKEEILRKLQAEREQAVEERRLRREAAKKKREWEKANPEKVRIRLAREEARVERLEQQARLSNKVNQQFSAQFVKSVARCNCIIQVLDARAPLASISDAVETMIETHQHQSIAGDMQEKTIVYLLNKVDLVPRKYVEDWAKLLASKVLLDDDRLKIKRRIALYSGEVTESPLALMNALQTVFLRGAAKHKIVAAVVGHSNTGKNTVLRDMEAATHIVSVHPSSAVPTDLRTRIPGAREVALVSLPPDSDTIAAQPKGFDCIFKQRDMIELGGASSDPKMLGNVAALLVKTDAVRVATHFKVSKPADGGALLEAIAKKRGLRNKEDGTPDLLAAGRAVCGDVVTGKLLLTTTLSEGAKVYGTAAARVEAIDSIFLPILKHCKAQKKAMELPTESFATADHRILVEVAHNEDDDDEDDEDGDKYEIDSNDWADGKKGGNAAEEEDEEMEEFEEVEEIEEGEEEEEDEEMQ